MDNTLTTKDKKQTSLDLSKLPTKQKTEKPKLPTIAELFEDSIEQAGKTESLNFILSTQPPANWIKEHPIIPNYRYLPIDKVEHLLRKIFKKYRIEVVREGTAFNGVFVVVRVHYLNPVSGEMDFHDGIGACQLQTKAGASPADLANINHGAISMAFPIAKTVAIKDACDHFGVIFGCNLNRKDTIPFEMDAKIFDRYNSILEENGTGNQ